MHCVCVCDSQRQNEKKMTMGQYISQVGRLSPICPPSFTTPRDESEGGRTAPQIQHAHGLGAAIIQGLIVI